MKLHHLPLALLMVAIALALIATPACVREVEVVPAAEEPAATPDRVLFIDPLDFGWQ